MCKIFDNTNVCSTHVLLQQRNILSHSTRYIPHDFSAKFRNVNLVKIAFAAILESDEQLSTSSRQITTISPINYMKKRVRYTSKPVYLSLWCWEYGNEVESDQLEDSNSKKLCQTRMQRFFSTSFTFQNHAKILDCEITTLLIR